MRWIWPTLAKDCFTASFGNREFRYPSGRRGGSVVEMMRTRSTNATSKQKRILKDPFPPKKSYLPKKMFFLLFVQLQPRGVGAKLSDKCTVRKVSMRVQRTRSHPSRLATKVSGTLFLRHRTQSKVHKAVSLSPCRFRFL